MTVTINGIECEPGCWVEGHWGQYGPDHLADKIDGLLDLEPDDDPRHLRQLAEAAEEATGHRPEPICETCGHECTYRRTHEHWVHVHHYRNAQLRVEIVDAGHPPVLTWPAANAWQVFHEATSELEERLNDITPDGWLWHWHDGECHLSPICDEDDCTDDTCAHWSFA